MSTHAHFRKMSEYQVCEYCRLNVNIRMAVSSWNGYKNIFMHEVCFKKAEKEHKEREDED